MATVTQVVAGPDRWSLDRYLAWMLQADRFGAYAALAGAVIGLVTYSLLRRLPAARPLPARDTVTSA
jgi:hypothetical protein